MSRITLLLSLIIAVSYCWAQNVTCPANEDISPCACYPHSAQIYCIGSNIDENQITRIGPKVKTEHGIFHLLLIRETKIKTIPKNAFASKFEKIFIEKNHDLTHIDSEAFLRGNVSSLVIQNNPMLSSNDIFDLARNLTPSDSIEFNENYIKEIPANAFAFDPHKSTITRIFLSNNTYNERIGKNAFIGNPHLTHLGLDNNNITTIDDYGLNFTSATTPGHNLSINLNNNRLNSNSFNNNTIVIPRGINVTFYLENNVFDDLNEGVFRPLAEAGHKFYFTGNKFYCNCKSSLEWLLKKPELKNIYNVRCADHNNTDIFKLTQEELKHCY